MNTTSKKIYTNTRLKIKMNSIVLEMLFETENKMSFTIIDGGGRIENGYTETVETKVTELRTNLFLITWKEVSGTTISQIHDFENKLVYTNITMTNGKFYQTTGTIITNNSY
ncbi:putative NUDIX family NTP pyrophosphohydrolase [Chryseobacterium defluvii]|uniref:Putative NUDIX family NTP pyrophosphohydrolase n=1 Tax=Chryseobacterium defluvii TaxID=160396 RepID=A0A840KHL2_9FLAO|nr:hypothetical protein [Chryseobacterium defluvii]MBB4807174.1 putative NUDIX family NTP pyrophosphohydrolase [Chryseobacterium defluvii]